MVQFVYVDYTLAQLSDDNFAGRRIIVRVALQLSIAIYNNGLSGGVSQ